MFYDRQGYRRRVSDATLRARRPALLKTLKDNYWHKACGTQQKLVVIRTLMNRLQNRTVDTLGYKYPYQTWWLVTRVHYGIKWLFYKQRIRTVVRLQVFIATDRRVHDIKDEVMANAELFSNPLACLC